MVSVAHLLESPEKMRARPKYLTAQAKDTNDTQLGIRFDFFVPLGGGDREEVSEQVGGTGSVCSENEGRRKRGVTQRGGGGGRARAARVSAADCREGGKYFSGVRNPTKINQSTFIVIEESPRQLLRARNPKKVKNESKRVFRAASGPESPKRVRKESKIVIPRSWYRARKTPSSPEIRKKYEKKRNPPTPGGAPKIRKKY